MDESTELDRFKDRMVRTAWRYAQQYGWCDEVKRLLSDLGVALTEPELRASVWVRYDVRGRVPWDLATVNDMHQALEGSFSVPALVVSGLLHSDDLPAEDVGHEEMLFTPAVVNIADLRLVAPRRTA